MLKDVFSIIYHWGSTPSEFIYIYITLGLEQFITGAVSTKCTFYG